MADGNKNRAQSKKPTVAQQRQSSERAAAARVRIAKAQARRRMFVVGGAVIGVLALIGVLIIVKVATGAGGPKSGKKAVKAQSALVQQVSSVPVATLDKIGVGKARTGPSAIKAPPLTKNGKPEFLYIGAEYCPYCAAERWAVAVALSRFGTLSGVSETESASQDVFPSTATLSFHDATYTSDYLTLTAKELQSNQVVNGQYAPLDKLSKDESATVSKYNAPPYVAQGGGIPFVDIAGKYVSTGASYDPGVLKDKTHSQIAKALSDPASPIAQAVDGTANLFIAAICDATGQKPGNVCQAPGVQAAAKKLKG
ncbi:MAG: DUF929 family protein [Jatrophihabitans sp.]